MLPFLRSDLAQLVAYTPHPGQGDGSPAAHHASEPSNPSEHSIDRLDTNENPYDLPEELKQKLAWMAQHRIESNRYPDGGYGALKQAIAQYVMESAALPPTTLTMNHISVGNGSDELIRSLLIATCLGGEGSILVAEPTFSMYGILANTLAIPVISVGRSESNFEIDLTAAQEAIAHSSIRVVFVVHPNSPTANALTAAELDWLRCLPSHILVVVDEAYYEFSQQTVVKELHHHPNWVILRTFSKAFRLAAHRVGYAIAHPELVTALEKVRLPYNLPASTQAAALLALEHRSVLLGVIDSLLQERATLLQALRTLPGLHIWDTQANFIFMRLVGDDGTRLNTIFETLRQQGTLIRKTCGGFRITVGTPDENQRTIARLTAILRE